MLLSRLREKPREDVQAPSVFARSKAQTKRILENTTLSTVYLIAIAGLIYMAAGRAYASEETEFNRRALGYYASLKQEAAMSHADEAQPSVER